MSPDYSGEYTVGSDGFPVRLKSSPNRITISTEEYQSMPGVWLPTGYRHGIHVIREPRQSSGGWTGGGPKGLHHITVTPFTDVHNAANILMNEGFEPNLLIGFEKGTVRPYLYQFLSLTDTARALEHPAGTSATNSANVTQVEIAAEVSDVPKFDDWGFYKVLANMWFMVNDHLPRKIPARRLVHSGGGRLTASEFINGAGYCGHRDAPNQPSGHDDPTAAFNYRKLLWRLHHRPDNGKGYWDLSGVGPWGS